MGGEHQVTTSCAMGHPNPAGDRRCRECGDRLRGLSDSSRLGWGAVLLGVLGTLLVLALTLPVAAVAERRVGDYAARGDVECGTLVAPRHPGRLVGPARQTSHSPALGAGDTSTACGSAMFSRGLVVAATAAGVAIGVGLVVSGASGRRRRIVADVTAP